MKITIHRGTNQIGGCVTEYEYEGWRLFVDYGEQLAGALKTGPLEIEGLTKGDISKSAMLITHYHDDHIGCITELPESLPIYIGKVGREIQMALSEYLQSVDGLQKELFMRLNTARTFSPGKPFTFGPFRIIPITIDHSAFDAYAFKIEVDDVKVFHSGDFRTHGFRSSKLPKLMENYIGKVDYMVCEATNVNRPEATSLTEHELQQQFYESFKANHGNVIFLSSTNIDRLFALYHAALKAGRPFLVDVYQKRIMDIIVERDPLWGNASLFRYGEYKPIVLRYEDGEFSVNVKFKEIIEKMGYVLISRATQRFNRLINSIPGEKTKYLSMWKGNVDPKNEAYNPMLADMLGGNYQYMHTSGHCDMNGLQDIFRMLRPKAIIPIHTDNPDGFYKQFCDQWKIILLKDGEMLDLQDTH